MPVEPPRLSVAEPIAFLKGVSVSSQTLKSCGYGNIIAGLMQRAASLPASALGRGTPTTKTHQCSVHWPDSLPSPTQSPLSRSQPQARPYVHLVIGLCMCYVFRGLLQQVVAATILFCYAFQDVLLARLTVWCVAKCPKSFDWSIESISIRPSWWPSTRSSEIVISSWTWHNPPGFKTSPHLLYVRRMLLEIDLGSVLDAIRARNQNAIKISNIHIDGVAFRASRNVDDALNLWVALDLPDQDVNAVVRNLGKLRTMAVAKEAVASSTVNDANESPIFSETARPLTSPDIIEPLPINEYERLRRSSSERQVVCCPLGKAVDAMFRTCRGRKAESARTDDAGSRCKWIALFSFLKRESQAAAVVESASTRESESTTFDGRLSGSQCQDNFRRQETMVGDPRRRPRWGVPFLFDIDRVVATKIEVDVMDLLTVRRHSPWLFDQSTELKLDHITFARDLLLRGDPRRAIGVYLGELVWTLIYVLFRKIVKTKPSRLMKNSTLAVAFAVTDLAHYTVARTLELAINAPPQASRLLEQRRRRTGECATLTVRLIRGRRLFVHQGDTGAVSCHAIVQLRKAKPENDRWIAVDQATTKTKVWTRSPNWGEAYSLGPIDEIKTAQLVVVCVHHERMPGPSTILNPWGQAAKVAVGEIVIPLVSIVNNPALSRSSRATDVVAWFRLAVPTDAAFSIIDSMQGATVPDEGTFRAAYNAAVATDLTTRPPIPQNHVDLLLGEIKIGIKLVGFQYCAEAAGKCRSSASSPRSSRRRRTLGASSLGHSS